MKDNGQGVPIPPTVASVRAQLQHLLPSPGISEARSEHNVLRRGSP